ncbi:MAG: dTDP-4-dehydrorhamnose 3,5-epimerase [Bacillota bacterium]|nr:dTDP-4-dehydrorhamnose 3,5-epimerase [Bacillota bacterium]
MGQIKVDYNLGGIEGLCLITPQKHEDARGYFMETYHAIDMKEAGFDYDFVQDNQTRSTKGVLRGLHYQIHHPQAKLIRVLRGEIFDVVVDLRQGSETYGKWYGRCLTADQGQQFLIPRGFAHGFLVLSDIAEMFYKCDAFYHPEDESGIAWNDPDLGIQWPQVCGEYAGSADARGYRLADGTPLILSEKDTKWKGLFAEKR